jgi:DNA-binding XRE family transcriptional regulator
MGRRLPDDVVHRIQLHIEAGEDVATIAEAVGVTKKTIYKLQLNLG